MTTSQHLSNINLMSDDDEDDSFTDDETAPLDGFNSNRSEELKPWDLFRTMPMEDLTGSLAQKKAVDAFSKIAKLLAYILTFILLLSAAIISKGTLLFMTSQIRMSDTTPTNGIRDAKPNVTHEYCSTRAGRAIEASVSTEERVGWMWAIMFCFLVPEFFTWFRSMRICLFRSWKAPNFLHFLIVALFETLHVSGLAIFVYLVLPNLKAVEGLMLTNCFCLVPGMLNMLSRTTKTSHLYFKLALDMLSIVAQLSGLFLWAALNWVTSNSNLMWLLPISLFLTSFGWWENYVDKESPVGFVRYLNRIKEKLKSTRYFTYTFLSIWKGFVFFASLLIIEWTLVGKVNHLFDLFYPAFQVHDYIVSEIRVPGQSTGLSSLAPTSERVVLETSTFKSWPYIAAYLFTIHASVSLMCFLAGKFACKIRIQIIGFALPINLAVPVTMTMLITFCGLRMGNACMFSDIIPPYLFFECPTGDFLSELLSNQHAWAWAFWLLSQAWITVHNWMPRAGRLAKTEQLFINPYYSTFLVEQSMAMNRRRDDEGEIMTEEIDLDREDLADIQLNQMYYGNSLNSTSSSSVSSNHSGHLGEETDVNPADSITRIYVCATMWHENAEETVTFLKSIFYLDEDQSARRVAQKYLRVVDPDYYEIETHIFFDDAFELSDDDDDEMVVNGFVKMLIDCMDEAASQVHKVNMKIRPPKKYPTPYGGRLVWTLPGKTKIIAHLKDKQKIRNRKRWSQVMYMYYLLGHKLMELPISVHRKAIIAQNTYLLALDGDIDFMPNAVHLLIDLMKRNANLAAACGRIHPVGSGLMAWYQSFEYAIGHWLQKATEHMIGCVLCSPGCFSLFRGRALMEDNVMAKYTTKATEARHYVQYDQGEDRWLCTLLLQRGFRVEYCAASDSYTHCPEGFDEFYNQRRRWVPSTMANILDLLMDYKRTIKVNDNISLPYIFYQGMLMVGTILGPGTIFLMIVGSFNVALGMDNWTAFYVNLIPIIGYMIICMTCNAKFQVMIAQVMSAVYAIVMMAVLVGIVLQLSQDGWSSPSSIFLLLTAATFIFSACLHPQEFWCLPTGLVYYLTVPSMYLLLIIYSVCNLNNVSWGTREVPQKKKKVGAAAEQQAAAAAAPKKKGSNGISNMFGLFSDSKNEKDEGSIELSLAGLFKIMCCVHRKPDNGEAKQLMAIAESLTALNKRLDNIERIVNNTQSFNSRKSVSSIRRGSGATASGVPAHQMNVDLNLSNIDEDGEHSFYDLDDVTNDNEIIEIKEERDNLINPYWLEDKALTRGLVDYLKGNEVQFWNDLIEKYLYPLDEEQPEKKKKIMADLKELRDKTVFTFFIINALYVTVVFLLTLEKDTVYIRWPLGVQYNISYVYYDSPLLPTVQVGKTYLKLEPIGLVFVFFFASVMIIQFIAMLFHRFGTLSQILASTELTFCTKNMEDMSDEAFLQKNAVEIAKNLQSLKGVDEHDKDDGRNEPITRRNTVYNLERSKSQRAQPKTLDLTAAFRKRIDSISPDGANYNDPMRAKKSILVRRETMKQLANGNDRRRSTILAEVRRRSSISIAQSDADKMRRSTVNRGHPHTIEHDNIDSESE